MTRTSYEIVATLGPGSRAASLWTALLDAGATAFRLNTSHLSESQLQTWLTELEPILAAHPTVPLVLDLQGSKWRLGEFATCTLEAGQPIEFVCAPTSDWPGVLPVPHRDFFQAAEVSSREIVLNDARVIVWREAQTTDRLRARVIRGGELSAHKGITYAASEYRQETLSAKDRAIFEHTQHLPGVRYALSYVRDAAEMSKYRAHFGSTAYLIAKLERGPAMAEAAQIATSADELWVCRGDLGAELGLRGMAIAVRDLAPLIPALPIPALMAGQVLEHMTAQPTPTRSEVCHLWDVINAGYRGVVLSDETAIGQQPIESVRIAALFRESNPVR